MTLPIRTSSSVRKWLCIWAASALLGCGGGSSEEERWGVDPHDAGAETESDARGGSADPGQNTAGRKSSSGGTGAAGREAAAEGGKGGNKVMSGAGGKGGAGSKAGTGGKGGAGGKAGAAGKGGSGSAAVNSAECLACEALNPDGVCKMRRAVCPAFETRKAMMGPQAGALKTDLCAELMECVGRTRCALPADGHVVTDVADLDPGRCLCGAAEFGEACLTMAMPEGECADEVFAASETSMVADVAVRILDADLAVGAVFATVQCDVVRCAKSCGYCDPRDANCVDADAASGDTGADAGM